MSTDAERVAALTEFYAGIPDDPSIDPFDFSDGDGYDEPKTTEGDAHPHVAPHDSGHGE